MRLIVQLNYSTDALNLKLCGMNGKIDKNKDGGWDPIVFTKVEAGRFNEVSGDIFHCDNGLLFENLPENLDIDEIDDCVGLSDEAKQLLKDTDTYVVVACSGVFGAYLGKAALQSYYLSVLRFTTLYTTFSDPMGELDKTTAIEAATYAIQHKLCPFD